MEKRMLYIACDDASVPESVSGPNHIGLMDVMKILSDSQHHLKNIKVVLEIRTLIPESDNANTLEFVKQLTQGLDVKINYNYQGIIKTLT